MINTQTKRLADEVQGTLARRRASRHLRETKVRVPFFPFPPRAKSFVQQ
jgi:hypothetical protein